MNNRVSFSSKKEASNFFECARNTGKFNSWRELAVFLNVRIGKLWDYRKGTYSLPSGKFEALINLVPSRMRKRFENAVTIMPSNWGQSKGGCITYSRHKKIFDDGRAKARENRLLNAKYDFDSAMPLNEKLCEFLGAFIGDGFTNAYNGHYMTQFAGHSKLDADYYNNLIIPYAKQLFGFEKPYIRTKANALWVTFYSKRLFEFMTKRFGFPAGKKSASVLIPGEVLDSDKTNICALLRGLFNTDGGVHFDKRKIYKTPYMRIELHMKNERIIEQVYIELIRLGINAKRNSSSTRVQINSEQAVSTYLNQIGFSNKRHLDRISSRGVSNSTS
ncbi:MAG: LAGLIDADG family homing endonuclease [Candidatus Diapherotrites archaeon]